MASAIPAPQAPLPRAFYERDPVRVARAMLGMHLVHVDGEVRRVGRIVETEAYLGPHDLACHSSKGLTARTRVMFGPAGHAYVYLIYGMHHCMNVVTGHPGDGSAVLLRALEPVCGIDRRTQGPGLLCRALGIDRTRNGHDMTSPDFHLAAPASRGRFAIVSSPRVGVDYAGDWAARPLRFHIRDNPFVSRP